MSYFPHLTMLDFKFLIFIECFPCARHCFECFTHIMHLIFRQQLNDVVAIIICILRCGNWNIETFNYLVQDHTISSRTRTWVPEVWLWSLCSWPLCYTACFVTLSEECWLLEHGQRDKNLNWKAVYMWNSWIIWDCLVWRRKGRDQDLFLVVLWGQK